MRKTKTKFQGRSEGNRQKERKTMFEKRKEGSLYKKGNVGRGRKEKRKTDRMLQGDAMLQSVFSWLKMVEPIFHFYLFFQLNKPHLEPQKQHVLARQGDQSGSSFCWIRTIKVTEFCLITCRVMICIHFVCKLMKPIQWTWRKPQKTIAQHAPETNLQTRSLHVAIGT